MKYISKSEYNGKMGVSSDFMNYKYFISPQNEWTGYLSNRTIMFKRYVL